MRVEFTLNGELKAIETESKRPFLEILREDVGLTGTKYGCGEGDCLACTVLVDGKVEPSCQLEARDVNGADVRTIEGLAAEGVLHPVQQAFLDAEAMQCGYCTPGMILETVALLDRYPKPTDEQIVAALSDHLCRCCGYVNILNAVRLAAGRREEVTK